MLDCAPRILPSLHLRSTCERRLRLHLRLHLRRMCEPSFKVSLKEMCYTSPLFPRLTIHLVSPSDIPSRILTRSSVTSVDDTNVQVLDCLATAYQRSYNLRNSPLEEYCPLVTAHTAPRRRYKDTIKKALNACSIVPKHWTATAAYKNAWRRLTTHQKTESGIHQQRIQNPVPEIWNLPRGIQNPILSWNTLHEANYSSTTPRFKTLAI